MSKIDNEIVKFIAEVEPDPQASAEYTKGLQEAEKHNAALRKSISETAQKMDELRAAGPARAYRDLLPDRWTKHES